MASKLKKDLWFIYLLKLSNGSYYTGITNNVEKRIKAHESGKGSKYVRAHLPLKLVYLELAQSKSDALKREYQIKRLKHEQKVDLVEEF